MSPPDPHMSPSAEAAALTPLRVGQLYRHAALSALPFATTAEIEPIGGLVGQRRALEAVQFGTSIDRPGFNLFVIGPPAQWEKDWRDQSRTRKGPRERRHKPDWDLEGGTSLVASHHGRSSRMPSRG
jgi:hypothetical protein